MGKEKIIPKNELKKIKKILIIQHKPFGDVLLNTGYLPFLRKKFPQAQIDYLIQKPYLTLLEDNPYIDNLLVMQKKEKKGLNYFGYLKERFRIIKKVRTQKYDLIIDQLRGTGSAQITLLSGAKYRIGWKLKRWNWVYNLKRTRRNDRYYSLMKFHLLEPLGIKEQPHQLYYHVKRSSQEKIDEWLKEQNLSDNQFIVFSPGTPVLAKQWSEEGFAKLGDLIQEKHQIPIVFLWGPGEDELCKRIIARMNTKPIMALPTKFNEAAALLKRAKMYISQDGGINHVAISQNCPSIAIFGPHSNPKKWQAWHDPKHPYIRNWDCQDSSDRTLGITPEMVYEKFLELKDIIENEKV
jgi:ADP-heptose:LPS heptosyltransferase